MDLGEQRALQDWYIKFALQTVSGVAEVASFGGFESSKVRWLTQSPLT
jgi:Cu(I)/Ag(I) efflux system membrane protein CusA/SilA